MEKKASMNMKKIAVFFAGLALLFVFSCNGDDGSEKKAATDNQVNSSNNTVVPDTTPPDIPLVLGDSYTNIDPPTWEWESSKDAVIYRHSYNESGWTETGETYFTPPAPLGHESETTLYVQAADEAGNWSASGSFTIIIDTLPPEPPVVSGEEYTNIDPPTWSWSGGADSVLYRYSFDELFWTVTDGYSYTPETALGDSVSATLYVQAADDVGNWSASGSFEITVIYDFTPPSVPSVSGDAVTNIDPPTWTWTSSIDAVQYRYSYTENGVDWEYTAAGSFTALSALGHGSSTTLYVQAADSVGNWSASGSFEISIDTCAPEFISGYPDVINHSGSSFTVSINISEPGTVYLYALPYEEPAPDSAEIISAGTEIAADIKETVYQTTFNGLEFNTGYYVYYVALDNVSGGNQSTAQKTALSITIEPGCSLFTMSDQCYFPYPSFEYQAFDASTETDYRVNYPEDTIPVSGSATPLNMAMTNVPDGASPSGAVLMHFAKNIHDDYLSTSDGNYLDFGDNVLIYDLDTTVVRDTPSVQRPAVGLFNYETGESIYYMTEMDMNYNASYPDHYAFIIRPMIALEAGKRHLVFLTDDIRDSGGASLKSPPAFAALRDNIPTTNPEVEDLRAQYADIFNFISMKGYNRNDLLVAWDYMVASDDYLLGSIRHIRDESLSEVTAPGYTFSYTVTRNSLYTPAQNSNAARIIEGTFSPPCWLDTDSSFVYDSDHYPVRQITQPFPYTMIIPQKATDDVPLPLVVFGHGIFGNGRDYLTSAGIGDMIQGMAQSAGAVIIATNWIGLSDGDFDILLNQVIPDLNRICVVTDRLQQSIVNNLVMTEMAIRNFSKRASFQVGSVSNELIDETKIYYYGVSLGGIQGSSFVSLSNRITRGVLAVPGSTWMTMISRSYVWVPLKPALESLYPDPLHQQLGLAFIQTWFDNSDPVNLTKMMYKIPPADAPPGRLVLIQESIGDSQVPNMTTDLLVRSIGKDHIKQMVPAAYDIYGINQVTGSDSVPLTESVIAQYHIIDQTSGPDEMPPITNVPPPSDNGVHSDMCFLSNSLEQILYFLSAGEIYQLCTDSCNPD